MTQIDDTTNETTEPTAAEHDRRAVLRKVAIGGAGAAIAAVALGRTAEAADGANLVLGAAAANASTTATSLVNTPAAAVTAGPSALSVGNAVPAAATPFPANVGGYGNALIANGLHGSTTAAGGFGVVAANLAAAAATATDPVPTGIALASVGGAHAKFVLLDGAVVGPTPGKHTNGELYVDKDYTLWYTVPVPAPAPAGTVRFVKLAGTPAAGSFHAINPQRSYDSRLTTYPVNGLLARNTSRVISVADGHSANGTVTLANAVPAGATAVQINVTAASPTEANFLSVTAGDVATTSTSLLNWNLGVTQIANSITVPVSATREIKVFCGDQPGSTHVIIDVFGYYL
jgi:hypothetical protein